MIDKGERHWAGAEGDWFYQSDAAVLVPELLKAVIGKTPEAKQGN